MMSEWKGPYGQRTSLSWLSDVFNSILFFVLMIVLVAAVCIAGNFLTWWIMNFFGWPAVCFALPR